MYILLALSVFLAVLKTTIYNSYAKKVDPDSAGVMRFNAISYGIAAIIAFGIGVGSSVSLSTLIVAVFYAVVVCSLQTLSVIAMKIGPMSSTSLMVLYGMIIPAIAGPIFWKEKISILAVIGIIFILASMWLLRKEEAQSKAISKRWSALVTILFFLSGFAGVLEKIHQSTDGREEKSMFLFVAYLIMFFVSVVGYFANRKNTGAESLKPMMAYGGISGIVIGVYAFTNLTLAGGLNSMIYYPVANGGAMLFTVLISVAVFKEKCTKRHIVGFAIGFISILLLSLPI